MNGNIPTRYNPREVEEKWYSFWQEKGLFKAGRSSKKNSYTIVIPPPNVTGILHMGHALNNAYQDVLIRFAKMRGQETLWMPGTDHAGIATQNVVEKTIAKEGLKRHDLGREKFLERVWSWRDEYGSRIIHQLKKLGSACDWSRTRFTMDSEYSKAVREVFVRLWNKGLIYQDNKVINWCPRCQTALSDEEAPHSQLQGKLYYLKYPLKIQKEKTKNYIVVATTRPETMLGDTAVAVNPQDSRYKKFIGKTVRVPLINREVKVIADSMVDKKFGTGAVKVTPAHDPNDEALGKRHKLEFINVMTPDAHMNDNAGPYKGLDRFLARERILKDLETQGLLEKVCDHQLAAGHCYRCHTMIEPYLSKQWFVKMKPLAKPAIEAVKKEKVKFYPQRWTKVYLNWMDNIQDWCISRQIWWGHRLPIYYCEKCQEANKSQIPNPKSQIPNFKGIIVSLEAPQKCPSCGNTNIIQDEDVLDTWFSSWLWPFATFGWPSKDKKVIGDLKYFYPTNCLVTAPEIIFFWVARMIMAGLEFMGDIPFSDVYIHGTVRDIEGKKMSKSLGNIIDPIEVIGEYGADALRFSLLSMTATGQDVFLSKEKFAMGRNFTNKVWNASRFILMNLDEAVLPRLNSLELNVTERWILSRINHATAAVISSLKKYNFNEACRLLYEFFWHEFCDWFIEIAKEDLSAGRRETKAVLLFCLKEFLKLAHPFMPYISEEIFSRLPHCPGSIMLESFPKLNKKFIDNEAERQMNLFIRIVTKIRNLRADLAIVHSESLAEVIISVDSNKDRSFLDSFSQKIKTLTKSKALSLKGPLERPKKTIADVEKGLSIFIPFDVAKVEERLKKLQKEIDILSKSIANLASQLKNKEFLNKAPKEIVSRQKEKLDAYKISLAKKEEIYSALK